MWVSNAGLKTAKKLVDFIEQPSVWEEMEFRRKILYHIAKAEFCRRERKIEIARCDAGEAQRIANKSDWRTELPNISLLWEDIKKGFHAPQIDEKTEDIDKLISKLLLECTESYEWVLTRGAWTLQRCVSHCSIPGVCRRQSKVLSKLFSSLLQKWPQNLSLYLK